MATNEYMDGRRDGKEFGRAAGLEEAAKWLEARARAEERASMRASQFAEHDRTAAVAILRLIDTPSEG